MASINDKLIKQGNGTQPIPTQLTAEKAVGASTASLAAATGWDTTTAKHVRMYKTKVVSGQTVPDQSTLSFYKATLSGTTLSDLQLIWSATGTDQKYDAGDTVDLAITSGWVDDLIGALLTEHNQDGTHMFSGAWASYTPTVANLSNYTLEYARYKQIGKTVHFRVSLLLTASSVISGGVTITTPTTVGANYVSGLTPVAGSVLLVDQGSAAYTGVLRYQTGGNAIAVLAMNAGSTYAAAVGLSSTIPHTWADTDRILIAATYEAA